MQDRDLKKLKREDLLEILNEEVQKSEQLEEKVLELRNKLSAKEEEVQGNINKIKKLEEENLEIKSKLQNREIVLNEAGNIADAALGLNNIFKLAQDSADMYLKNIEALNARQEAVLLERENEVNTRLKALMEETEVKCIYREREADEKIRAQWEAFHNKANAFISSYDGLKQLFSELNPQGSKNVE